VWSRHCESLGQAVAVLGSASHRKRSHRVNRISLECNRPFQSGGQHSGGAIVSTCSPDWLLPGRQRKLNGIQSKGVDWIHLAQDRVQL
jgi:hypothetical protein